MGFAHTDRGPNLEPKQHDRSIKKSVMNVTEPANLKKGREREENTADLRRNPPDPLYTKGAISSCHNKCKLGKAQAPPASAANDSFNYGA